MTDILRIKRRAVGGAAGPPSSLIASEVAFNEQDNTLYYGKGNSGGVATSIIPIAGPGAFLPLAGGQLSGGLSFGSRIPFPSDPTNTTGHISLFDGWGGFSITGGSLNIVAGGALQASFSGSYMQFQTGVSLFLSHDPPTTGVEAATKNYVDAVRTLVTGSYVLKAGDQMSGPLHINASATGNPTLFLANYTNGSNTNWPAIVFDRSPNHPMSGYFESDVNGLPRWSIDFGNPDPETGGNTGTNFDINRFDDAGHVLSPSPLVITRATGTVTIATPLMLGGDPTANLQAATKQYVDNNTITPAAGDARWVNVTGDTMSGTLAVGVSQGAVRLSPGGGNTGYVEFFNPAGVRQGYVGFAGGSIMEFHLENATTQLLITGSVMLTADPTAALGAATKQYADKMLPLAGGTVTGDTWFSGPNPQLNIAGPVNTWRTLQFYTGAAARWNIQAEASAEPGGNAGSDLLFTRWLDNGSAEQILRLSRASGSASFGYSVTVAGALSAGYGVYFQGGNYQPGVIYTDANFGCLIRGKAGAIYDVALADNAGSWWVGLSAGGLLSVTGPASFSSTVALGADPTTAMQAVTKQYSDRNKQRGLVDVTSNAASPSVSDVDWGYLYVYGSPTAPSTITMPVATTVRVLWTVNNVTSQPTTIRGTSGGTVTIPSGASQAVWTDTAGIYALYNAGATRAPGDSSTYWATTQFVQGSYLPLAGGTLSGPLTINSNLSVSGNLTSGALRANGWLVGAYNTGTPPPPDGALYMGWNFSQGGGESFFFNSYTPAATSFNFHQLTGSGTSNRLMSMLANGSLSLVGNIRFEGNAPAINDLSKHIALNSTTGFNVWGTQLNSVVPTGGYFNWTIGTASVGYIDATGINYLPIGATGAAAGTFTTLTTSGVVRLNNGVGIAYDGNNYIKFEWAGVVKVHVDGNNYVATLATQDWVTGYYLALTGGSLSGGLHFGSATSPGNAPGDTSRHLTLYDGFCGFSVTPSTMNVVCAGNLDLYGNNILAARITNTGLQMFAGAVTLLGDPTSALQAATKQYVDRATSAFVTVMQYGATGNGTADDTAAINAALSSGAKAVFFPLGTYKVSGVLTLPTNVMAWGLGGGSNIVTNQATGDVMRITGGGTEVVGLTFTSSVTRSGGSFINLTSTGVCKIRECFGYGAFVGITVSAGPTYILNCYFRETVAAGTVIAVTGGFNIRIRGCFHDTSTPCQYGIRLTGNIGDVAIGDCDFIHSGICLSVEANAGQEIDSVWVHDTFFDTSSFGIKMVATSGLIRRCQFNQVWTSSHTQVGFDMETGGTGAEINGIEIHGHHAFLNANAGLLIKDSGVQNVRVTGSNYAGNAPGISVGLNCSAFAIHGCNCSSYSGIGGNTYGIAFLNGCDNFYIQNCNLEGNSVGPVFLGTPAGTAGYTWWVSDNLGFHTLGKGSFTLPANNLNATISHGLSMPATVNDVQTWALSGRQNITNWWVDNVTATTFRFNCYSAATIDTFWAWEARINGQ